jgi:hypothetical protein
VSFKRSKDGLDWPARQIPLPPNRARRPFCRSPPFIRLSKGITSDRGHISFRQADMLIENDGETMHKLRKISRTPATASRRGTKTPEERRHMSFLVAGRCRKELGIDTERSQ